MAELSTYLALLAVILTTGVAIKPPKSVASSRTEPSINDQITQLEDTQVNLKVKVLRLTAQRASVLQRLTEIEEQLATQEELSSVQDLLRQCEARNQEMMVMLSKFERFFGSLYAESPDAFDPTVAVDVRMSKLNSYLGNREAELLALRPAPTTIVDDETANQELLGNALYDMEEQRSNFDKKLRKLEDRLARATSRDANNPGQQARLAAQIEDHQAGQDQAQEEQMVTTPDDTVSNNKKNKASGNSCNCRNKRSIEDQSSSSASLSSDEISERLDRLENLMVLQLLPILNETLGESTFRGLSSNTDALYTLAQMEEIEEEISSLRANKPDSKKVAFSAARTTHLFGENFHQTLEFDHVFLNKGGHFNEENSTFICGVPGYYFVTFTVRSLDGYVLGALLMKNEDHVVSIFTDADERNVLESQSVIVHLEKGDHLYILHPPSERFAVHSDRYRYTTFSAFLIFKGN